jgi:PAS domain S-box-containing protein
MESTTGDLIAVQPEQRSPGIVKRRPNRDPLLIAILGTAFGLAVLVVSISIFWGSGPVIAEIPWYIPMVASYVSLTTLCLAFLALGRYQVLRDPVSFWSGAGFASLGIGQLFYVLSWPGLMSDGGALIADLTNTPALITDLNLTILGGFLLAAVLVRWPGKKALAGQRGLGVVAGWLLIVTLIFSLIVSFEEFLPVLVRTDGTFTPLLRVSIVLLLFLFAAGSFLSTRHYLRSRDALAGYVAFAQMTLVFLLLMTLVGGKRYDLWWYLQRLIGVSGYLVALFGLLFEYVRLIRRERESEARYRQLTEALPQMIWTCTADGLCDYLSPQWIAYTGIPEPPQLGQGWLGQLHPQDRQPVAEAWRAATTSAEKFDIEFRVRRHDGRYRWFKTQALPIRDLDGRVHRWFGSCTDIEEQKRHAALLERSNRDLQNFTAVASHDLQEPLRKIEALGDAVLEGASKLDERQYDLILRMRKSAQQMRDMVNGLLQLSLLSTDIHPFQPVDLGQVMAAVLEGLDEQIRQSGGAVEAGELPVIEANPVQMHRLLQHLIENALKFQKPGGEPRIKIFSQPQPPPGTVQILVEDNGIGFDEAHAGHLFEPFKRLVGKNQSRYDGSGMGLAICRWIVERHGGEITASSKSGQGTTFIVTLPIRLK